MTLTKPSKTHSFTNGTVAQAPQVNTNFNDIFGVLEEDAYLAKGWFLVDNASFEYHASNAIKTTSDVDLTSILQAGDKITFEQATDGEYFAFVTKLNYDDTVANRTYVELFVYEQNAVEDEAITANSLAMSRSKNPWGFPLDEAGWSITTVNSTDYSQAVTSDTSWYNLGSISITVPAGAWLLTYAVPAAPRNSTSSTEACNQQAAIGTTTTGGRVPGSVTTTGSTSKFHYGTLINTVPVNPTSSQIYYLQSRQGVSVSVGSPEIRILGSALQPTRIKATIAYL